MNPKPYTREWRERFARMVRRARAEAFHSLHLLWVIEGERRRHRA